MKISGTTYLETNRLFLRPLSVADAPQMFENWASDADSTHFLTWEPHNNLEDVWDNIKIRENKYLLDNFYDWGIVIKGTNTLIVCWHTFSLRGFSLTITIFPLIMSLLCTSILGILFNVMFPNFTWTSEMVVVKQGLSTILTAVLSLFLISLIAITFVLYGTTGLAIISALEFVTIIIAVRYILNLNYI
ncbi:GNAT family N-acetyltransferase [Leuconostoc citreum]|uniref:GNAT family N-acetyltransferase n=1 Tax=Leuconostoc citreum TaxID=33964 RepID=UPI00216519A4|nr:GNAT family N-acetyltransferase [Leuconostoc citreum]UVW15688.1 GNAT family N-acetyltransferase [Leuconostoc citreum]